MRRKKFKVIEIDLFPWDVLFTVGTTEEEITTYLKKKFKYVFNEEELEELNIKSFHRGKCIKLSKGAIILWVREMDHATIAHEALHATTFILNSAGLTFSDDSDEAWAYMIELIMKKAITN